MVPVALGYCGCCVVGGGIVGGIVSYVFVPRMATSILLCLV